MTPPTRTRSESLFEQAYGAPPEGVWAAPGRVNLIGEHTDYNDGFVLPFALGHRVLAAVGRRDDGRIVARSTQVPDEAVLLEVDALAPGAVDGWGAYVAGAAWAVAETGVDLPGLEIHLDGDVPRGAGLSSSAALVCAVVTALNDLLDLGLSRVDQARLGQRAENSFVGAPTGMIDQLVSMLGEQGHAIFVDTRDLSVELVPLDLTGAGLQVLILETRVSHAHTQNGYGDRRSACEAATAQLGLDSLRDVPAEGLDAALAQLPSEEHRKRVRHVVTENARVLATVHLLRQDRLAEIGPLLTASHTSLREDCGVSCLELDVAVDAALAAGALGARMVGGGFGGSAIALVSDTAVHEVQTAVHSAFGQRGFRTPRFFSAVPSPGAGRL